jgi:hypothetical protein
MMNLDFRVDHRDPTDDMNTVEINRAAANRDL